MSPPAESISVGIIGAGQIVANQHLPTLLNLEGSTVSWITDASADRARTLARAFGVRFLELPPALSNLPPTDALLLAIPYGARPPYYEALRGRAMSLYVEKPFARSVPEHRRILEMFPRGQISVGFQRRSSGVVRSLRDVLSEDLFGPLRGVRVGHGRRGHLTTGTRYAANLELAGGGILIEVGIHLIDAALFVTDARAVRIERGRMIRAGGFDLHTEAAAILTLSDGREVPCEIVVSGLIDTLEGVELLFDHAHAFLESDGAVLTVRSLKGRVLRELRDPAGAACLKPFQVSSAHWEGFFRSIREAEPNWTSAGSTILTTQVIESLHELGEH